MRWSPRLIIKPASSRQPVVRFTPSIIRDSGRIYAHTSHYINMRVLSLQAIQLKNLHTHSCQTATKAPQMLCSKLSGSLPFQPPMLAGLSPRDSR